jgi:hypothetical protein
MLDIGKVVERILGHARSVLSGGEEWFSTAFLFDPRDEITIISIDPQFMVTEANKDVLAELLKSKAEEVSGIIVFVSDAWMLKARSKREVEGLKDIHNHPDRVECLMVSVFGPGVGPMLGRQVYRREVEGLVWDKFQWLEGGDKVGRFLPDMRGGRPAV